MNCCKCSNPISSTQDAVSCIGCSRNFHANCEFGGSSTEIRGVLAILRLRQNVIFLCTCCKTWIVDSNFGVLVEKVNGLSAVAPDTSKIEEDIATNRKLIESLSAKLDEMSSCTSSPVSSSSRLKNIVMPGKHQVAKEADRIQPPQSECVIGSCEDVDDGITAAPVKKFIYASKFTNTTTPEALRKFLSGKLMVAEGEMDCRLLVAAGREVSSLSFVSFKIEVGLDLFNKLMQPDIWPSGVLVREFISRPKNF